MRLILLFVLFTINMVGFTQNVHFERNSIAVNNNLTKTDDASFLEVNTPNFAALKSCTPTLNTGSVLGSPICAGTVVSVPYTFTDCVDPGNMFTVELSDALGSFATPTVIGSLTSTTSGTILSTIPASIVTVGNAYRIRVNASSPNTVGADNGVDLTIIPKPNAGFTVNAIAQCISSNNFVFSNTSTGSISSFSWDLGDGNTALTNNASNIYSVAGDYNVKLVVTGSNGCKDSVIKTVSVNSKPTANFTIANATLCQGNIFNFTNTSTIAVGSISYTWNFGDAATTSSINANHNYNSGGSFDVKLVALSNGGCIDSISKTVTVLPKETALFTANTLTQCGNLSFVFTNNTSGITTSFWTFGDGITSTVTSPAKIYSNSGTYTVKLVVTNVNGCKDSTEKNVNVLSKPNAAFNVTGNTNCSNNSTFTFNNTTAGIGNTYFWTFGDGNISSAFSPSNTYSLEGTYVVQLLVINSNGCRDSISKSVTFSSNAAASFTINNATQCVGTNNFVFTNTSNGNVTNSSWNFGDGITSTVTSPAKNYTVAGTYAVKLVVTNSNGCKDSTSKTVTINTKPIASFSTNGSNNCTNSLVLQTFNTSIGGSSYLWNFGDNSTSTLTSPIHTYAFSGTYTVKLVVTNINGCKDSTSRTVTFAAKPVAAFTITNGTLQCLSGNSFAFDNASTSSQTYLWSFGDGTTSTLGIPTPKTYSAVGTYTIKLVATNVNGCKDSLSRNVIVVKSPKAAFNAVYQTCGGLFVQFKQIDTTTTKFSVWDFGDGSTPVNDVFNTTHFYSTFGTYTIKYYAYDATSTCIDSATKTITLTNSPAASIHNSTNAKQCLNGNSFNFSSNSLFATSYAWTFGDGSTSSLQNPAPKVYSNPGIYTVKLTVSNSLGCTSTTTIQDTVLTNPKANFNVIYQPCNRANIKFIQIDTTGTKYSAWDFGDGNGASDVFNTTHSYASINSFNIKYYAYDNNFYCLDSATKTITFSDIPAAGIGYPYTSKQCFNGNSFAHTNTSIGASSYLWEFGDGSTSTAVTPPAKTFVTPGIYTVKLTVFNASGCIGSTTVLDTVLPSPKAAFTATYSTCNNLSVQFTQINTLASKWSYLNFGDGKDTVDIFNVSHLYTSAGTYTLSYTAYDSNFYCSDNVVKVITLNPKPTAGITYLGSLNLVQCSNNNTYSFFDASNNAVTYFWDFGDGTTSTLADPPAHTYTTAGNYIIKQVVTGLSGCKDSATVSIKIVQSPKATFTATYNVCNNLTVQFAQANAANTPLSTWNFGDGNSVIDVTNTSHTYATIGSYTVTYSAFNTTPVYCEDVATKVITFTPNPTAAFTVANTTQCLNGNVFNFNNTSLNGVSYVWYFGDGSFSTQQTPSPKTYPSAGTYTVKQVVTNASGCKDSITLNVTVSQNPIASFAASYNACNNLTVQFAQTNTSNTAFSAWDFGDGNGASDVFSTSHIYATTGTYIIKYYAYNASFTCVDSATKTITLSSNPTVDFTFSSLPQCVNNNSISLQNISSNASSYIWTFGDGGFSFATNPTITYASAGTYFIKLVATNANGCKDSITKSVTILPKPVPSFNIIGNSQCNSNLSISFDNTTTGVGNSYLWVFGDGDSSVASSVTKTYTAYGTYNVKLIVTNAAGCKDSITKQITFTIKPTASFSFISNNQCINPTYSFTNNSTNYASVNWTFGDGGGSTAISPIYTYFTTGTFTVKLVVTNANGCKDSSINTIAINPRPIANFNIVGTTNCTTNKTISINNTASNAVNFYYDFGDGTTSTLTNPTKTYSTVGTYVIKQVVTNINGCKDSTFKLVTFSDLPTATFNINTTSQCLSGNNFVFTNTSTNVVSSVWSFGDGFTSIQNSTSHSYTSSGIYVTKLVVTNANGCTDSTTTNVIVVANPQSIFSVSGTTGCSTARTITIQDNAVNALSYFYNFGDGNTSTLQNPTNTYTAAGTYIIKQVVTNANGCKDSSFKTVVFNGFPTAAFGVNTTSQCLNQNSFLFTNTSANVVSSVWNFGDGNTSTKTSTTHTYTGAGVFTVKLLVTNANGCKDSISTSVVVIPSPVSSFSFAGATNCTNNRTVSIINNATNAVSYYYDFGDGTTSTLSTPTKTYATLGTYLVKQIVTSLNGCKDSSINTISFDSLPTAVYTTNSSSQCLNGNSFVFTNTSNAALSSVWSFGDGDKSTQNSTSHSFVSAGIFAVKLVVTNAAGCKDSLSRNVTVLASPNSLFGYTGNVGCTSNRTITVVDSASNALNYFYDFGDGTTSTLVNPSKTYSSVGTYTIKQVVTNANGCKDSSSKTISFSDFPIALFNVNTASQCVNNNAYSFVNASNNAINYFWDFGDGTTSSQSNPTQTYNTAGTYTVKLIAISTGGCKDSTTNTITILPKPTAVFTFTGITNCTNNRTINIVNNAIGATSYYYDFGDGTTSTLAAPSKTYTTTGVFTIKQVVTNVNGCKDSTTKTVTFTGIPIAAFTAVGNANCSSTLSVVISNTSTDATIYNWSFGDGTTSTLATPTKTYANTGTYTIKLVVSNAGGCKDSTTKVVTVSAKPIAAFTIPNFSNCSFGNTFNFNNISTNAVSYAWNFGDGGTSNLLSPSYTYTASGTYNVKLVVKGANGCLDSMIRTISFVARPIAAFTTVASTSCNNSFTFNNTSVSNATSANYMWTFGDASFSILQSPVKAYTNPGTYTVVLVVTNSNGCRDTTSQLVTVAPKPVAAFTIPNFNSCNNGNNITVQSTSTNVTTINWNFGDGTTATGATATKTYSSAGTYTITLVVANANGCADSTSKIITLSSKPAASFSINSITQCVNSNSYNFTNTSTIPSGTIQYTWLFGDGTTSTLTNPTKVYSLAGTYTVKLIATSASGSCNDTASSQVTVLAKPSSSFTVVNSSLCSNTKTIAFNNTSTNVASTTWNFGDGNTSAVFSPTNTYLNYGTYTVSLITKNTNGCSDTLSRVINIAALPTATFSINNNSQCSAGNNFVFTNTSSNATNYVWSFGDNVGSATTNPSHSYSSVGNFVVSLIATNINGCIDTSKTNVTVKASSVADFTYNGNTNCTSNLTLAFTNNSTNGTSYLWSFGDGINSAATSPTHTYSIAGTYTISLIASNASGCSDTATQTVTFNARPTSSFSIIGATQCVNNNSYSFTNSSINATSYLWSFGDGATSSLELPTHSYTVAGNYTVTLVATNTSGCSSTSTSTITVAAMPSASFTLNNFNACAGNNSIVFNNTSTSAATYSWNFGNGNTSSATNPAITYAVAGTYTITLTATNANGCIDTASQTISLFDKPTSSFNIASSATQCVGSNNFSFINNSINASSYLWNFGDGATSTLNSPTRIYTGSGTFTVTLTVSNTNGCTATSSATVTLLAKPTSSFNLSNYNSCLNNRTISPVNTSTNASSYFWDFGDGILTNETNPVHTYVNAGTYVVTLISLNGNGCTDTLKKTVSIVNKPVSLFAIGGNATQCLNNNIFTFVNYSTNAATYSWDFGDGATATNANTSHTYSSAGTYTITLTVTSTSGCTTTSSQTIIVNNKPNASFVVNAATQCLGGNVFSFTNTSVNINNVSYVWNFGDSNYTTQTNATKIYAKAGTYNVILTATNSNGCVDSAVKTIVVNNTLTSSFVVNAAAVSQCTNATIAFTNKTAGTATSYLWRLGDGTTSTLTSPSHTYTSAGFYVITLISYSGNCIDSSSQTLIIGDKPTANFTATSANSCSSVYDLVSTSTGSIIAYAWKFSDSTVNANSTLSYGFTKSGNQSIKLVVSSAPGCSDSITKTVNVLPKPTMSYTQNAVVGCINDNNFTFTSTTTASALSISNFWDFGDGTSSTGTSVTKSYSKPGVYNVKLVSTIVSTGCKDSLTQPVTVYPKPTGIISGSVAVCKGTSAILRFYFKGKSPFTATYTDGKSNFSINNIADTVYDLTVVPDVTTTYRLISVKDAICTASENDLPSTATVTIHTLTYTKQPENVATCLGKDVRFISTAFSNTTFTYQWFKNGIAIPGATDDTLLLTNVSTLDNGFYKLATVLACGSYTSNTVTLRVDALPPAPTYVSSYTYCQYDTAQPLTATGTVIKWYDNAISGIGSIIAPVPPTKLAGTYQYWVTNTTLPTCETPRFLVTTVVLPAPTITAKVVGPTTLIPIQTVTLTATASTNAVGVKWYRNNLFIGLTPNNKVVVDYTKPGTYYAEAITTDGCKARTDSIVIKANAGAPGGLNVNNLLIYPNPTRSFINMYFNNPINENVNIRVVSMLGQVLKQMPYKYTAASQIVKMDVTGLHPEMYVVEIVNRLGATLARNLFVKVD